MRHCNHMLISAVICCIIILNGLYAQATDVSFSTVSLHFVVPNITTLTEGDIVISIYDGYDASFIGTQVYFLKRGTTGFSITFNVPQYSIGKKFIIRLIDGAESIYFDGTKSSEHIIETYSYASEDGFFLLYQTDFYMTLNPNWSKEAEIHIKGISKTLYVHCFMDDEVYITTDLLDALGINYRLNLSDLNPNIFLYSDDAVHTYTFYLNNIYAVRGNEGYNLNYAPFTINDFIYVPLEDIALYFACSYLVTEDNEYKRIITMSPSAYKVNLSIPSNIYNAASKTNYLIWVSKSNFTVNVYMGSAGNRFLVKSFPCAIGAPSTPTIEGTFEYYQYQTQWNYDKFYCGPIMRFYNGYAIHSTLISYSGKLYDNRVGMKISHGCVRVRPGDINWLVQNIPLHTCIIVTT